jgi:hypothetical protein
MERPPVLYTLADWRRNASAPGATTSGFTSHESDPQDCRRLVDRICAGFTPGRLGTNVPTTKSEPDPTFSLDWYLECRPRKEKGETMFRTSWSSCIAARLPVFPVDVLTVRR